MSSVPGLELMASDHRLEGRVALVIGANGGIGNAAAHALLTAGAEVVVATRSADKLDRLLTTFRAGPNISGAIVDLEAPGTLIETAEYLEAHWGRLDILVIGGGIFGEIAPMAELDIDEWQRALEINLTSNLRLIQALNPLLLKSAAARPIFIGSGAARSPRQSWAAYCVSKAALEALVRNYALEVEGTGIKPVLLNPGAIRTAMRAGIFPDEDPNSVTAPEKLGPFIVDLSRADGNPDPIMWFAEWRKAQEAQA